MHDTYQVTQESVVHLSLIVKLQKNKREISVSNKISVNYLRTRNKLTNFTFFLWVSIWFVITLYCNTLS